MKRSLLFWLLAFLITAASAVYQRATGPTQAVRGKVRLGGAEIRYRLERSHGGETNHPVRIETADSSVTGQLFWKRFRTSDAWTGVAMVRAGDALTAELPHQPPAGKLEYRIALARGGENVLVPAKGSLVIRFKGEVPAAVLIVHFVAMFGGMMLSTRAGLEGLAPSGRLKSLTLWTAAFLLVGGLILGPVVQWYAFGAAWTGWPVGHDLTDNKTAVAFLAWLLAAWKLHRSPNPGRWVIAASLVTLIVFVIPHSVLGSELDYSKLRR